MPVREFRDAAGHEWRVWDVKPDAIWPQTRAEEFLAGCFRGGWLVFETVDGAWKRRLCPLPYAWDQRTDDDLVALLDRAEILRPRGQQRRSLETLPADVPPHVPGDVAREIPRDFQGDMDMSYLGVVRSITYPGGEEWSVRVVRGPTVWDSVLRFTNGDQSIDVADYPTGWEDLSEPELVRLMRRGLPTDDRRVDQIPRRYSDPPPRD
jgi:hypothetical protein